MGCPAMHRWEQKEKDRIQKERLSQVKSTLNTRAPVSQPHLTLYGRDYVAKKKATTEAAFSDLKMIQAIARTMTRKQHIPERKGPVSLNADSRKAEIFRVMSDNHRLLEHIDSVSAFCDTREILNDHKAKRRYLINASHTSRMTGDYNQEITRFAREDDLKFQTQKRSTQLRRDAAERMRNTSGSFSLPTLTSAASSEPVVPPHAKQGAKKMASPQKGWHGSAGDADLADHRHGGKPKAKPLKPNNPAGAAAARSSEPPPQRSGVRFSGQALQTPPGSAEAKMMPQTSTPHPTRMVKAPSVVGSDFSEAGEAARAEASTVGEGVLLNAAAVEDPIVIEDDFVSAAPTPQGRPPRGDGEDQEPLPAEKSVEEPPPVEREEVLPAPKAAPPAAEEQPATVPPKPAAAEGDVTEPPAKEPILAPSEPEGHGNHGGAPDNYDDEGFEETFEPEEEAYSPPASDTGGEEAEGEAKAAPPAPPPPEEAAPSTAAGEEDQASQAEEKAALPLPEQPLSPAGQADSVEADSVEADAEAPAPSPEPAEAAQEVPEVPAPQPDEVPMEMSYGDDDDFEEADAEEAPAVPVDSAPAEPRVSPHEALGVSSPSGGLNPVSIARPVKPDAGAEDQGQDEYADDYEDDFVDESATFAKSKGGGDVPFEESGTFEESNEERSEEDGA